MAPGNLIADSNGSTTYNYGYNNSGRLATLTVGSTQTSSYSYDGLERLAIDASPFVPLSGITQYVYDQAGHLLAESDDSGNTLTEYVWLDDMPIALIANVSTSPTLYFVHTDHLNRPIMMTDANKAIVWQADYNPFGGVNSITGSAINNLRFPGQYFLIEDGLHYNWYRHYDPTIGRHIQPDPLEFVDGPNIYTYVNSRPTMQSDAKGRQATAIPGSPGFTPVPGVYIPGTPQNQDWVHHTIVGFKGLVNFCLRIISGDGGRDGDHQRCLKAADGDPEDWEDFCRSLAGGMSNTVGGETAKRACWSKTYEPRQNKKNWCENQFGNSE